MSVEVLEKVEPQQNIKIRKVGILYLTSKRLFDYFSSFLLVLVSVDFSSSYYSLHSLSVFLYFFGSFYFVSITSASSGSGKMSSYFSYLSNYKIFAINFSVASNLSYVFLFSLFTYLYQFLYLPLLNLSISTFNTNFSLSDLSLFYSN